MLTCKYTEVCDYSWRREKLRRRKNKEKKIGDDDEREVTSDDYSSKPKENKALIVAKNEGCKTSFDSLKK